MSLLQECYDVLRGNKGASALLDDLGVETAGDLRLLDTEDFVPMLVTLKKIQEKSTSNTSMFWDKKVPWHKQRKSH